MPGSGFRREGLLQWLPESALTEAQASAPAESRVTHVSTTRPPRSTASDGSAPVAETRNAGVASRTRAHGVAEGRGAQPARRPASSTSATVRGQAVVETRIEGSPAVSDDVAANTH